MRSWKRWRRDARRHPLSALVSLITHLAALCTVLILGFLVAFILIINLAFSALKRRDAS